MPPCHACRAASWTRPSSLGRNRSRRGPSRGRTGAAGVARRSRTGRQRAMGSKRIGRTLRCGLARDAFRWTRGDPLAGRISSQGEVGTFSWDWEAEPWKTDDINYGSRKKWCLVSTVAMDLGLENGDMGKGFKMNRPKGNFTKKQQASAMEHVSVKPNERRKKLSLL